MAAGVTAVEVQQTGISRVRMCRAWYSWDKASLVMLPCGRGDVLGVMTAENGPCDDDDATLVMRGTICG